jgi:hypothetical protein
MAWGVRADEELHAQVAASIASAKSSAKALIPWATLGATGISVLLRLVRGGGTKTKRRSSVLGTAIRGAIELWPIVSAMMQTRR